MTPKIDQTLVQNINNLPTGPGVYFFKNIQGNIIYVGKAKNLRTRARSYLQRAPLHLKEATIVNQSHTLEYQSTKTELEAMLLEAKLIQNYQPCHNVIYKSGQPFLYILFTKKNNNLPRVTIVRNKKNTGSYFGPFIEKTSVRRVYDFIIKTFRLKLCSQKIAQGCLYYHLDMCAGSCRENFDKKAYEKRLELAKKSLQKGHKRFLVYLAEQIEKCNKKLEFEQSKELSNYHEAFSKVFSNMSVDLTTIEKSGFKDIWIFLKQDNTLMAFTENNGIIKKKNVLFRAFDMHLQTISEYFLSFYHVNIPPPIILINTQLTIDNSLLEKFLTVVHRCSYPVHVKINPSGNHFAQIMHLATTMAHESIKRRLTLAESLKRLLLLPIKPHTIDCFDISHKQGFALVGSCIRFVDGKPDKKNFRHFKIKNVRHIDDYASLREVVTRRYKQHDNIPDLILVDGGKGQLNAVKDLFPSAEFVALAKREETIFSHRLPNGRVLNKSTFAAQTLISLRDYAHHFAISYHRLLAKKIQP